MPVIDADTHILETEDSWEYMRPEEQDLKPTTGYPSQPDPRRPHRYWLVGGKREFRFTPSDAITQTTEAQRELLDVPARLAHMDELGVDVQVIYPTLFLSGVTSDPAVERAVRGSYNRWLADRCSVSQGRLRWISLPPLLSMDAAIEELRYAKDHGACGVLKKGNLEGGKWPNDEYFWPLYEEAEKLDLPICFHTGTGEPDYTPARQFQYGRLQRMAMPVPGAFHVLITMRLPQRFPGLRWGFVEAGASWLPFVLYNLRRHATLDGEESPATEPDFNVDTDVLRENHMYVTCQVDEDLAYLLKFTGEDNLMLGSDYSHADSSRELRFMDRLRQRAAAGHISERAGEKILHDNPRTFYGL